MPYQVVIQENPDYIRAQLSGSGTPGKELKEAINIWVQIAEACRANNTDRVLAISDISGPLPTMMAYGLADAPQKWGWDRCVKVAVVSLHKERLNGSLFAETVAFNRGFSGKVFEDEQEAKSWLLEP